jgi:PKD repeat protein
MHVEAFGGLFRRAGAVVATTALLVGGVTLTGGAAQAADPAPTPPTPATVTADALPTWQINGVVWSQVVVGTTVYATGSFTKARPPGVAAGGVGEVDALNLFAYDITTGNRVASFNHSLNAQGLSIVASPDGSKIYVGGDFTTADDQPRSHVAVFNTADNLLTSWATSIGGQVKAVTVSPDTVYVGGAFTGVKGGQTRGSFASFATSDAALQPWAPIAGGSNAIVATLTMSPDRSKVLAGGSFETLSGVSAYGMGAIDATTGAILPWAATARIRTAGLNGGITSLQTDGTQVYGSGYAFGSGASFEGTFAANPDTGAINWVNDCLGDTYSTAVLGQALYSVGHTHDCTVVGGFPDTSPRSRWQEAMAAPTFPTGMTTVKDAYGWDFRGLPYAGLLHWYPDLDFGTYTAERQAAWTITTSGNYLLLGGEFPKVNGQPQQGLVRYGLPAVAPKLMRPIYNTGYDPIAVSTEQGQVRVRWGTVWDRDDATLTYDVYRDNSPSLGRVTSPSIFWKLPALSFVDTGQTPGTTHTYQVRAKDQYGNVLWSVRSAPVTISNDPPSAYADSVRADGATHLWRLDDSGPAIVDAAGAGFGTSTGVTFGQLGAVSPGAAVTSSGGSTPKLYTSSVEEHAAEVTVEGWIKTTSSSGGRIAGFGTSQSGTSNSATNDLVLYVNSGNKLAFALMNGTARSVASSKSVNDGQWHHVAATAGSGGVSLFLDGRRVARDQTPVSMATFAGYWRLLADQTSNLPSRPTNAALAGSIDEVAVYPSVLSQSRLQAHYLASGRAANWSTPPTDPYAAAVTASSPESYWRLAESAGATTAVDSSASGQDGTYVSGVSFGATGSPATGPGKAVTFNGSSGLLVNKESWNNPRTYSAELWFKTNTTTGGKLIGFGNATTGLSGSYDRQVVLLNNGHLQFGTNGATRSLAESTASYNNNQWHHVVATQGADGMKLYVDGVRVATNAATDAQSYLGWWRVGGDRTFGGTTSNYVAADIDEVAVYPTALTSAEVRSHFEAAGGTVPNTPPTASFTSSSSFLTLSVNGTGSSDPDGSIVSQSWDWGDSTPAGSGATATHTYAASGSYPVTLTVTDDRGATATTSRTVTVSEAPNQPPVASFTHVESYLKTTVDGSASSDPDGSITTYAWSWGDGTPDGSGATANHTYAADGTYSVTLTVTDNKGTATSTSKSVTVAANVAPTASFTDSENLLALSVNGSASSDSDGTIAGYSWSWGDGTANSTGATATHAYATAGTYTVTLTVTDDQGLTGTSSRSVTVQGPPNQAPTARFTHTENALQTAVDGSTSSDADGTVAAYAWSWGDGTPDGAGATATHTYGATGTYTVTLTVTDDKGATNTVSA